MEKGRGKGKDTLQTDNGFAHKKYIEREAAIDALQNHYEVRNAVQNGIMDECVMLMMRVPAADVVPVRHGRWMDKIDPWDRQHIGKCSECGQESCDFMYFHFCPNCGADMREES